jgi:hypothetical protein
VKEKEDGCVVFGLGGRCGEASFLFYALSSGPAGPAMLAHRGATQRDELPANLSQAKHPTNSVIAVLQLPFAVLFVSIDASSIDGFHHHRDHLPSHHPDLNHLLHISQSRVPDLAAEAIHGTTSPLACT